MTTATETTTHASDDTGTNNGNGGLFDKTICLVLSRGSVGTTRKAKEQAQMLAAEAVEASPNMVMLNKKLFKAIEYKAIKTIDSEYDQALGLLSLPSLLKPGIYAIPIPLVEKVDESTRTYIQTRSVAVDVLKAAWDRIVTEAETELGPQLFDPRNYPSADRLGERFYVEYRWLHYGVPSALKAIKASIWTDERAKAETDVKNAKDAAIQEIRARALKLVAHVVDRLTPADDGKRKVFRDTIMSHMKEFVDVFPVLNTAAGDTALAPIVERARLALAGIDPQVLRDDELVRRQVAEKFASIQTALDGMVITQTRRITFEGADDDVPF